MTGMPASRPANTSEVLSPTKAHPGRVGVEDAAYDAYDADHLRCLCGRRRGARHGPLSAAQAERDDLRTLTAVTDTPTQRAESALGIPGVGYQAHAA